MCEHPKTKKSQKFSPPLILTTVGAFDVDGNISLLGPPLRPTASFSATATAVTGRVVGARVHRVGPVGHDEGC